MLIKVASAVKPSETDGSHGSRVSHRELELDAETAQTFWPMYNAHKEELLRAGEDLKETQCAMNALQGNADAELYDLLNRWRQRNRKFPACVLNS